MAGYYSASMMRGRLDRGLANAPKCRSLTTAQTISAAGTKGQKQRPRSHALREAPLHQAECGHQPKRRPARRALQPPAASHG